MKFLLDTHVLLWSLFERDRLPRAAADLIGGPGSQVFYSLVAVWEVEIKKRTHPDRMDFSAEEVFRWADRAGYHLLPLEKRHVLGLADLRRAPGAPPHKDPFDRILICQARAEGMRFLTHDALLSGYGEPCVHLI